jgi:hypothetical protein
MSSYKLISLLFPFIKEMVLGEKSLREALKTNKMRVFLVFLIMFSFFCNVFFTPKLIRVSADLVILEKKYKELQAEKTVCPEPPKPSVEHKRQVVEKPTVPVTPPESTPETTTPTPTNEDHDEDTPPPAPRVHHPTKPTHRIVRAIPASTPQQTDDYLEWKKSFDDIRTREEHEEDTGGSNRDLYKGH